MPIPTVLILKYVSQCYVQVVLNYILVGCPCRLEPILCFIGFGCLLSIMGPKHFPFHARTNGVGPPQVQNPPVTFNETTGWNESNRTFGTQPTY